MAILVSEVIRAAETGWTTSANSFVKSIADLRRRLSVIANVVQVARWEQAMKAYLSYQVWEAAHRSAGQSPTVDQYAVARIRNGSMEVCAVMLDIVEGYMVPPAEFCDPDVRALTEMACSLVGWDNDIASYFKEHERSEGGLDLVDVIARERGRTPGQALREAMALRDSVLELYLELTDLVSPLMSPYTRRYIRGLSAWVRGNLDWSANTPRYRRNGRPTIAVTGMRTSEFIEVAPPPGISWWWSRLQRVAIEPPALVSSHATLG
jgi:hypothetical protein